MLSLIEAKTSTPSTSLLCWSASNLRTSLICFRGSSLRSAAVPLLSTLGCFRRKASTLRLADSTVGGGSNAEPAVRRGFGRGLRAGGGLCRVALSSASSFWIRAWDASSFFADCSKARRSPFSADLSGNQPVSEDTASRRRRRSSTPSSRRVASMAWGA